jgi:regulator of RNase E activity RraA
VTSGGVRDVDEIRVQQVPVFARYHSQSMTQGRIEYDSADVPITIGDVLVHPGDIVVADGDGVIVVPLEHAEQVAKYARQEYENDKAGRRRLYQKLGWALDHTVQ